MDLGYSLLCAVVFPIIKIVEEVIFAFSGCFECQNSLSGCKKLRPGSEDFTPLSEESLFTVSDVAVLFELFKQLSSSIMDDDFIQKEELQLALCGTSHRQDIFLDRRNGVIEFEEFVHALNIFHPHGPMEGKIDFAFKFFDLRQTGYIEPKEVKQLVIAMLEESDMVLSDEVLEEIVGNTFADADADKDGKIGKEDWEAFVTRHPSLLKNMTLPHLKNISAAFPSFSFDTGIVQK
ncbi:calcineurin B-like protein 1 isoform X2 [Primulina tabacum]|uniref:calcineurin B-like protein 1 isoform X2 n=1 Tax=Primulina tabacum TaxID=48773 RepID=UPI003F5A03C5